MTHGFVRSAVGALDRRAFLAATSAMPLASAISSVRADGPAARGPAYPGLIVRQWRPENFEFPFATLDSFLTPTNLFYVRSHFGIQRDIDRKTWRLRVEGHVERPLELAFDDLRALPSRTQIATLECSGNGRVFLVPRVDGVPWELGAVSNAEWAGVPLAAVLDRAGLKLGAVDVVCEGADSGETPGNRDEAKSPGKIHFARGLTVAKAHHPEVLLAYKMNGEDLTAAHGFPLRLLVPGWYGMASVKWLRRIVVMDRPYNGYFQTMVYSYFERRNGLPTLVPTTEQRVKAQIARPARDEVVGADTTVRVRGAAWTGESEVAKVEVSADAGKTWHAARLVDRPTRYAWSRWEYDWRTPARPGRYALMARATDRRGSAQPLDRDPDLRNALVVHVLPLDVEVR